VLDAWTDQLANPVCHICGRPALEQWRLCGSCWAQKFGRSGVDRKPFTHGEQLSLDQDAAA